MTTITGAPALVAPIDRSHRAGAAARLRWRSRLAGHLQICRFDHWVKNVFVLPGVVVALSVAPAALGWVLLVKLLAGLIAVGLVASSNYVLNELLDARTDALHPTKRRRPVPAGRVNIPLAWGQWLLLMLTGLALAWPLSPFFARTLAALWVMGCVYNIPPVRSKDVPYLDVLSEAVNNPLRFLAGWYLVAPTVVAPVSLLLSYWMVGCYFMAIKRFSEYRMIADAGRAAGYRKSFAFYSEPRLLISILFYASSAMLFFGAFVMRYRLELILAFPLIALVMSVYLAVGFKADSAAQAPEHLYREPLLMIAVAACAVAIGVLLYVDVPALHHWFPPTLPVNPM